MCHVASVAWVMPSNGKQKHSADAEKKQSVSRVKKVHQGSQRRPIHEQVARSSLLRRPQEVARKRQSNK